jgi:hypothetical protein
LARVEIYIIVNSTRNGKRDLVSVGSEPSFDYVGHIELSNLIALSVHADDTEKVLGVCLAVFFI